MSCSHCIDMLCSSSQAANQLKHKHLINWPYFWFFFFKCSSFMLFLEHRSIYRSDRSL